MVQPPEATPQKEQELQNEELRAGIVRNADYGVHPDGALNEQELAAMHHQVEEGLATTNGDAGTCVISTRQLALLLAAAVR
jgi:hypothetical protein